MIRRPDYRCLVARTAPRISGFAIVYSSATEPVDLLEYLACLTVTRGWARLEWRVLDWNEPSIAFYRKLGAEPLDDWTVFRVTGEALQKLASKK